MLPVRWSGKTSLLPWSRAKPNPSRSRTCSAGTFVGSTDSGRNAETSLSGANRRRQIGHGGNRSATFGSVIDSGWSRTGHAATTQASFGNSSQTSFARLVFPAPEGPKNRTWEPATSAVVRSS